MRTYDRERLPKIPDIDLAKRYYRSPVYERATLVLREHPDIPVLPIIAGNALVHEEWRDAAARVIAKDPNFRYQTTDDSLHNVMRLIVKPPTEEETATLRAEIDAAAREWRLLERSSIPAVPDDDRRAAFRAALWSGDWAAAVGVWSEWVGTIAAALNHGKDRERLALVLCVHGERGPAPTAFRWAPGQWADGHFGFPDWPTELTAAMQRVGPGPLPEPVVREDVPEERDGKHDKRNGQGKQARIQSLDAARAAVMAGIEGED